MKKALERWSQFNKEAGTDYREASRLSTGVFLIFLSDFFLQVRVLPTRALSGFIWQHFVRNAGFRQLKNFR
jgi:hypothetical protein